MGPSGQSAREGAQGRDRARSAQDISNGGPRDQGTTHAYDRAVRYAKAWGSGSNRSGNHHWRGGGGGKASPPACSKQPGQGWPWDELLPPDSGPSDTTPCELQSVIQGMG